MDPNLNLPNILVSFESSIKSQFRFIKKEEKCPKLRISKELVDNLNLFMNRFVKQVMSSAILIAQYKKVKTITENELSLVFHTMLNPKTYVFSVRRIQHAKNWYKEYFIDNPNPKKPATLKEKYNPNYMQEFNPYLVKKAMRLLIPKGYRINEMAVVYLTMTMYNILDTSLYTSVEELCKLLKNKDYKGSRILTYDQFKEKLKTNYSRYMKYLNVKFYNIGNVCKLLP